MTFEGNQDLLDTLLKKFLAKTLYPSLLFVGNRGIGKATLIKELIKNIIEKNSQYVETSKQIKMLENYSHPDIFNFGNRTNEQGDQKMTLDGTREIIDFMNTLPSILPAKFAIIDSINEMNNASCNAILKILEEPRPNTYFFIICHNLSTVIKTVISRCVKINISPPSLENSLKIISQNNSGKKNLEIDKYALLSQNSAGDTLFLMDINGIEIYEQFCLDVINKTANSANMISKMNIIQIEKIITIFVNRLYIIVLHCGLKKQEISVLLEEEQIINIINKSNNTEYVINNFSRILQIIRNIVILNNNQVHSWHEILSLLSF